MVWSSFVFYFVVKQQFYFFFIWGLDSKKEDEFCVIYFMDFEIF